MTNTKLWFYFGLAIMCFALSVNTAASQTLEWFPSEKYDDGVETSVADTSLRTGIGGSHLQRLK